MHPKIYTETLNGKKVFIHDYKGMSGSEFTDLIPVMTKESKSLGPDQLIIIDVTGSVANGDIVEAFKKAAKEMEGVTKKMAVVGVTPFQTVILKAVNLVSSLGIKPFPAIQEAMKWLVEE